MFHPVPGFSMISVLVPPTRRAFDTPSAPGGPVDEAEPVGLEPTVLIGLHAAFGMRDVSSLPKKSFAPLALRQLRIRLRTSSARGPVRLLKVHQRDRGEVFGSCIVGGRVFAFTAVYDGYRISTFRVL